MAPEVNKVDKVDIALEVSLNNSSLSPLLLFRELSSKGKYPLYPLNSQPTPEPTPGAKPTIAPSFTPARHRELSEYYCSRPRAERLTMMQRARYLRAEHGWEWDVCDCQAFEEHLRTTGAVPPFTPASDIYAAQETP